MVALDLTPMDKHIVRYVQYMKNVFAPDEITFAHVIPHSLYAAQHFTEPVAPLAKAAMKAYLDSFPGLKTDSRVRLEVGDGSPMRELLQMALKRNADMIVVGLKKFSEGSGILPRRLIRRAPCPILFVPRMKAPSISHVWVPVDFSKPSVRVLKYAEYLRNKVKDLRITASHAIYLPAVLALHPSWSKKQEKELRQSAEAAFDKFITANKLEGIKARRVITRSELENPAADLLESAKAAQADLIIIGPEGHSMVDQLIVGSVTEKMLTLNHEIPTLVLK